MRFQHAGIEHKGAHIPAGFDQVAGTNHFDAAEAGQFFNRETGIFRFGIDAGANGGAAEVDLAEQLYDFVAAGDILLDVDGKGLEFLA